MFTEIEQTIFAKGVCRWTISARCPIFDISAARTALFEEHSRTACAEARCPRHQVAQCSEQLPSDDLDAKIAGARLW